jgi:hypothetical protein
VHAVQIYILETAKNNNSSSKLLEFSKMSSKQLSPEHQGRKNLRQRFWKRRKKKEKKEETTDKEVAAEEKEGKKRTQPLSEKEQEESPPRVIMGVQEEKRRGWVFDVYLDFATCM